MISLPTVKFGNVLYREYEGASSYVESYCNVAPDDFNSFVSDVQNAGYVYRESHRFSCNEFYTFANGNDALFLSYYPSVGEMRIVEEAGCNYLSYTDSESVYNCEPLLTHVDIEGYGLSYVIRLSDGRFIIFDGGHSYEPDVDRLMDCLVSQSNEKKPGIAAWVLTHPHKDHYPCFASFCKKYSDRVNIEKLIFNFPDASEETMKKMPTLVKGEEMELLSLFYDALKDVGADVYRAHTGQIYKIGDATLEILSSPDDVFFTPVEDINPHSLVIKMTICSQTIMWCADTYFKESKLAERYGNYLKCDIVQLTHHGYCGGTKKGYSLMNTLVCLAPESEEQCLSTIDFYYDYNKYLFCDLQLEQLICGGGGNVVLTLPHKPLPNSRVLLADRIKERQKSVGANTWYFSDLPSDELKFTFVNMTYSTAEVLADIIYAESTDNVYSIKICVSPRTSSKKDITDLNEVDGNAFRFNAYPLSIKGVKKGEMVSVRFTSNIPVVISGAKNAAYYH